MMCTASGQRSVNRETGWEECFQTEFTAKKLPKVWASVFLEEKVGAGLGRGEVLQ